MCSKALGSPVSRRVQPRRGWRTLLLKWRLRRADWTPCESEALSCSPNMLLVLLCMCVALLRPSLLPTPVLTKSDAGPGLPHNGCIQAGIQASTRVSLCTGLRNRRERSANATTSVMPMKQLYR